jgi:hypothetical protein
MAKKKRKSSKAKSKPARPKAAKPRRVRAKARPKAVGKRSTGMKPTRKTPRPTKVASAFQLMIDTINETERLREKYETKGSDETA